MRKVLLLFALMLTAMYSAKAQTVYLDIDINNHYYFESGCGDCNGSPDPRWSDRIYVQGALWAAHDPGPDNVGCGWLGYGNTGFGTSTTQNPLNDISVQIGGNESDGAICGGDDFTCGNYNQVNYIADIDDYIPCNWNSFTGTRNNCGSLNGTATVYGIQWSYYWYYTSMPTNSISGGQTACSNVNPSIINGNGAITSAYLAYQWQQSTDGGGSWSVVPAGEAGTSSTTQNYDPGTVSTTVLYRRAIITTSGSCHTAGTSFSNTVGVIIVAPPTLGTLNLPAGNPINFCNATGDFFAAGAPSVSGQTGTVNWEWGSSNNGWNVWGSGNAIPGTCCFPKKVSNSDGNADRFRYYTSNSPCANSAYATTVLVNNRFNEAPSSVATSNTGYCAGSISTITLTATFPAATNILGTVEFAAGSCGGSPVASVAGNGTTTVSATIPAPATTQTYYARYNPGTGSTCTPSTCVQVTVNVSTVPTVANAGSNQSICSTGSANLAANTPTSGTGAWSIISGPSTSISQINNPSAASTFFNPTGGAGTYTLRWTISNSPCTPSTSNVVITVFAPPTTAAANVDQNLCTTTPATLAANTPAIGSGVWSIVSGPSTLLSQFSNTASPTSTFTPAGGAGTYTLRWSISNGVCTTSTDDVVLTYAAPPTTANANVDQTLCTTVNATLAGNTPTVGTGTWSVVSGPNTSPTQFSNVNTPGATFTPVGGAGTYTLRWTIASGACPPSSDDMVITYNAPPTTSNAGVDQNGCTSGTVTLAANPPSVGTGTWSVVSGPSTSTAQFSNVNAGNAVFTPAGGAGTYTLRWTITNAPCTASFDDVVITFSAPPTTANASTDQNLCTTATAFLAGNTPSVGVGVWSIVSGPSTSLAQFSNTALPTSGFTPSGGAGTYVLRWTINNAPCTSSFDDVSIFYTAPPTTSAAGTDQTFCATGTATLGANTPTTGTGAWSVVSGPSTSVTQFNNASNPTTFFTPLGGAGTYILRWTISSGPCTASTDDVVLVASPAPTTSNAGPSQNLCTTTNAILAGNTPVVGTGTWSVVSGPSTSSSQFSNVNSQTATFTPAGGPGVYTLRWSISNPPCAASNDDVVITYSAPATVSAAGPDQNLCTTTPATLAANTPTVGTGVWSVVSGPSTSPSQFSSTGNPAATFTPVGPGTFTLRWTITSGACTPSTDDVVITYAAPATVAVAGANQNLCTTNNATLAANNPTSGTGTWSVVSGPSTSTAQFSNVNAHNATFTPAGGAGTYTLRWTISNNPCTSTFDDVVLTYAAPPTVANAGSNQNLCTINSASLAANTPVIGTGVWSIVSGPSTSLSQFSSTSDPSATFTQSGGAGTYTIRWTISNGACPSSSDDITLTFAAPPTTAAAGGDQTLCTTSSAILAANTPTTGTGTWSIVSGPSTLSSQINNASSANTFFTPAGGGGVYTLRWTISSGACTSSFDDLTLTYAEPPTTAAAGTDQEICLTTSASLNANTPSMGTGAWSVITGPNTSTAQFDNVNDPTASFTPTLAGTYTLRWTITSGVCSASFDNVIITVRPLPTASISGTTGLCAGGTNPTITFTATPNTFVTYNVNGGATQSIFVGVSGSNTVTVSATNPGVFTYNLIDVEYSFGTACNVTLSGSATVTVFTNPNLVINDPAPVCIPSTVDITAAGVTTDANGTTGTLTYYTTYADAVAGTNAMVTPQTIATTGTYYVKKVTTNGCVDIAAVYAEINNCLDLVWNGSQSTDWNDPLNWTPNYVPTPTNSITVPDVPNDPYLQVGANGVFKNIQINAGATINIAVGKTIDAKGNWTGSNNSVFGDGRMVFSGTVAQTITGGAVFTNLRINNNAGVTIAAGAPNVRVVNALELRAGALTTNNNLSTVSNASNTAYIDDFSSGNVGTINGNVKVQRFINSGANGFRYIGTPVNTSPGVMALSGITGFTATGIPGQVVPLPTCDPNNTQLYSPYGNFMYWQESGPFTVPGCKQSGWYFQTTGNISVARGYGAKLSPGNTITYTGRINTGNISGGTLSNTTAEGNGWHLVSNPYPSAMAISNIDANPNNNMPSGFDGQIQFFQASGAYFGTYQAYNVGVQTAPIALGQGFWIHTNTSGTYNLTNNYRTTNNPTYYNEQSPVEHHLNVNVSGNGFMDQTDINFVGAATVGFDYYDANKWAGRATQPMLYTKIGDELSAINSVPSLEEVVAIPMGFRPGVEGNYSLSFTDVATFPSSAMVYLEDLKLGTMTDLRAVSTYDFSSTVNDDEDRFVIHFNPGVVADVTDQDCGVTGSIEFTQPAPTVWASYDVKDNAGNVYAQGTNFSGSFTVNNLAPQEYILTLTHANGYVAQEFVTVNGVNSIQAGIDASAVNVAIDETVTLTATAPYATEYVWDFGDGNIELGTTTIQHAYDMAGVYNVTLTASNEDCEGIAMKTINVNNTTTGIINGKAEDVKIYGAGEHIVVEFNNWGSSKADIFVYNALGQAVSSFTGVSTLKGRQEIYVPGIVPGYYMIQAVSNGSVINKKVFLGSN